MESCLCGEGAFCLVLNGSLKCKCFPGYKVIDGLCVEQKEDDSIYLSILVFMAFVLLVLIFVIYRTCRRLRRAEGAPVYSFSNPCLEAGELKKEEEVTCHKQSEVEDDILINIFKTEDEEEAIDELSNTLTLAESSSPFTLVEDKPGVASHLSSLHSSALGVDRTNPFSSSGLVPLSTAFPSTQDQNGVVPLSPCSPFSGQSDWVSPLLPHSSLLRAGSSQEQRLVSPFLPRSSLLHTGSNQEQSWVSPFLPRSSLLHTGSNQEQSWKDPFAPPSFLFSSEMASEWANVSHKTTFSPPTVVDYRLGWDNLSSHSSFIPNKDKYNESRTSTRPLYTLPK